MRIILLLSFLFAIQAQCAEFGEYRYSKYIGVQQQLQNQRNRAIMQQRKYYQNPTRNIRYPSANNPYPNIQKTNYQRLSPNQRYSARFYNSL